MRLPTLAVAAVVLLSASPVLAVPSSPAPPPAAVADEAAGGDPTAAYGRFLAGRTALTAGDSARASALLVGAAERAPGHATVRDRAFSSALVSGDVAAAATLAPSGEGVTPAFSEAGRLAVVVNDLVTAREAEAAAVLSTPLARPHGRVGLFLAPWVRAAAGDWDAALAPEPEGADPYVRLFGQAHRAQLLEIRRRPAQAEALYRTLMADSGGQVLFRSAYGAFLERHGRAAEARALYAAATNDDAARIALARMSRHGRPDPVPTLRQGAAHALGSAAAVAVAERSPEFAVVYLRMALVLDPADDASRVLLGDQLVQIGLKSTAREVWSQVPTSSTFAPEALTRLAWGLQDSGDSPGAQAAARRALAVAPDDSAVAFSLAGVLSATGDPEGALAILARPDLNGPGQDWRFRYARGAALKALGRRAEAEAELTAALAVAPDNAEVQNYLGYLWIDGGRKVDEGVALVERAARANPQSGAYQDSLGWGRYRQGDYAAAVTALERAVVLSPASADINDHLGDAYWQADRRREAGYQWNRVLTLAPDATLRGSVERKLADGLSPPQPVARP